MQSDETLQKSRTLVNSDRAVETIVDGRFKILSLIGKGRLSSVYKALDMQLNREVALKFLDPSMVVDDEAMKRFQREAVAVSILDHPNIARVYSSGVWDGSPYVAMQYVEGVTLGKMLKEKKQLSRSEALPIFLQLLDALAHAHGQGIIHRDIKPNNVLLAADGTVKLLDFGIAKILPQSGKQLETLTRTGHIMGSLQYMSPEQCMGFPVDQRSDLYSLGCLMFETLVGKPPVYGTTDFAVVARHMEGAPAKHEMLADDFGKVVLWAMAKDGQRRPESAHQLKEALLAPEKFRGAASRAARTGGGIKLDWKLATVCMLAVFCAVVVLILLQMAGVITIADRRGFYRRGPRTYWPDNHVGAGLDGDQQSDRRANENSGWEDIGIQTGDINSGPHYRNISQAEFMMMLDPATPEGKAFDVHLRSRALVLAHGVVADRYYKLGKYDDAYKYAWDAHSRFESMTASDRQQMISWANASATSVLEHIRAAHLQSHNFDRPSDRASNLNLIESDVPGSYPGQMYQQAYRNVRKQAVLDWRRHQQAILNWERRQQ